MLEKHGPIVWGARPTRDGATMIDRSAASTEDEQRRLIVDAAENGMLIVDEGGVIEYANAEAARIFGYMPGVLDGSPVSLLECSALRASGDGGFEASAPLDPIVLSVQGHAVTARRADGALIPIEIETRDLMTRRGRLALVSVSGVRERRCKHERACPPEERAPGDAIHSEASRPIGRWRFEPSGRMTRASSR